MVVLMKQLEFKPELFDQSNVCKDVLRYKIVHALLPNATLIQEHIRNMQCKLVSNSSDESHYDPHTKQTYKFNNHGSRLTITNISDYLLHLLKKKDLMLAMNQESFKQAIFMMTETLRMTWTYSLTSQLSRH